MSDSIDQATFDRLRHDMMQFVLDELSLRAASDESFTISAAMADLIRDQINQSIWAAVEDRIAAEAIAQRIASQIRLPSQEGASQPYPMTGQTAAAQGQGGWRVPGPGMIGVVIGVFVLIATTVLIGMVWSGMQQRSADARALSQQMGQLSSTLQQPANGQCAAIAQLRDQLKAQEDTPAFRNQCGATAPGRDRNETCKIAQGLRAVLDRGDCSAGK